MDKKLPKDLTVSKWKEKLTWLLVTDSDDDKKRFVKFENHKKKS